MILGATRRRLALGWATRALALAALLGGASGAPIVAADNGRPADLCTQINALAPGGELALPPGDYAGPCAIRTGGLPGQPIVVRAQIPGQRPRIVYDGRRSNVIDVRADHVTIRGLAFGPTHEDIDGVRVYARDGVTVEDCEFSGLGGIAVVASHRSNRGLVVRRNTVRLSTATAMYFGCHDGVECVNEALLVEGNYIHSVRAPDPQIGYGIQVKLNSWGVIRDNVVVDTKGPGIMVYGSLNPAQLSLVEGNLVVGSLRSSGIIVGGGPAVVRNNIVIGNALAGVGLEDYGRRGLLRGVVVAHNTLYGNEGGPLATPSNGTVDAAVVNNALHAKAVGAIAALAGAGLRMRGNVNCSSAPCFTSPDSYDFSPIPGGPLVGAGVTRGESWAPSLDFFGTRRRDPPSSGAVETSAPPLRVGPKF
jgi:hypothetical protein